LVKSKAQSNTTPRWKIQGASITNLYSNKRIFSFPQIHQLTARNKKREGKTYSQNFKNKNLREKKKGTFAE